jgi:dihydroceramidase
MPYYIPSPGERDPAALLQVFEESYTSANTARGYWGPVEASIDWCERNYAISYYVAEWWNTVSNLSLVLLSLVALAGVVRERHETRILIMTIACLTVGVGSAVFHGTLSHLGQQSDELPMVWAISSWTFVLYAMDPAFERRSPLKVDRMKWFLVTYCVLFSAMHWNLRLVVAFQTAFMAKSIIAGVMLLQQLRACKDPAATMLGKVYAFGMFSGFTAWLIDVHFCEVLHELPYGLPNPELHAWWHVLTGLACYSGPAFLAYRRAELLGRRPRIVWWCGIPTVRCAAMMMGPGGDE